MSRGLVVAKGSPHQLVERFECENLDEVFIYLARVA
jgi:ABC-2 type transport system ATP-binding protein